MQTASGMEITDDQLSGLSLPRGATVQKSIHELAGIGPEDNSLSRQSLAKLRVARRLFDTAECIVGALPCCEGCEYNPMKQVTLDSSDLTITPEYYRDPNTPGTETCNKAVEARREAVVTILARQPGVADERSVLSEFLTRSGIEMGERRGTA